MEKDVIDLGTLKIPTLFRRYFVPTLFGMLSISAVTAIDGIFVGHGVGSDGIAAINIYVPLLMIFQGFGLMAGVGCSVVASIHLSRGKEKAARLNVTQALLFVTLVTLLCSALLMLFPRRFALLLGSSEHLLPLVVDYLSWFTPALVFQLWTAVGLFIIRLDGAPRLAMWCSIVAAALSVAAGGLIAMHYLLFSARRLRLHPLKRNLRSLRLLLRNIGSQCRIGSSALLGEATLATLMFVGNQVFMHYLGDDGVGAFGVACYYAPFVFMVGNAIAQSAQPIISYNFGIARRERVAAAARIALTTAVACGAVTTAVFVFAPQLLTGLFLAPDTPAAKIAAAGFPYFSLGFVCFIVNLTAIGYYQSLERARPAALFALLRGFLLLVPSFVLLPEALGEAGIWLAMPLSEALTTAAIVLFALSRRRDARRCRIPSAG